MRCSKCSCHFCGTVLVNCSPASMQTHSWVFQSTNREAKKCADDWSQPRESQFTCQLQSCAISCMLHCITYCSCIALQCSKPCLEGLLMFQLHQRKQTGRLQIWESRQHICVAATWKVGVGLSSKAANRGLNLKQAELDPTLLQQSLHWPGNITIVCITVKSSLL